MHIKENKFGILKSGEPVTLYTLANDVGMAVSIMDYGGTITAIMVPDRVGKIADVVLGFDTIDGYFDNSPYFGCIVGRYANRIAGGKFSLNGVDYSLAQNDGMNHLHGGEQGFDKVIWDATPFTTNSKVGLNLTYVSRDGEEGYPGDLFVNVMYTLTNENALQIEYRATTNKQTILNLTNHTYFNLVGQGDILNHEIAINAAMFTVIDKTVIPTGELRSVAGTPLDFSRPELIGARIEQEDDQLIFAGGYDHNWVLNNADGQLILAATVSEPTSGRILETYTTQPGLQFYSGNFLDGTISGKNSVSYAKRCGFCLETQHFPDSPNQPSFPSTRLMPGEQYFQTTIYRFSFC